jgi:hypothetical protein
MLVEGELYKFDGKVQDLGFLYFLYGYDPNYFNISKGIVVFLGYLDEIVGSRTYKFLYKSTFVYRRITQLPAEHSDMHLFLSCFEKMD